MAKMIRVSEALLLEVIESDCEGCWVSDADLSIHTKEFVEEAREIINSCATLKLYRKLKLYAPCQKNEP